MPSPLVVPVLIGRLVRLEPMSMAYADDLVAAADEDRSAYGFTWVPAGPGEVGEYIRTQLARAEAGELIPFAQVRATDGRAVGGTTYLNIRVAPGESVPFAVEIGWTWLAASAQRSGINTEAKLLLLTYAFETWGVVRVDLKTDARNQRSRSAIERIGARFEGVLRSWQPSLATGEEGSFRDSAMHSLLAEEWPAAKVALQDRLTHTN
jgi:RimJ/RimL family protein N-acetyltransferase